RRHCALRRRLRSSAAGTGRPVSLPLCLLSSGAAVAESEEGMSTSPWVHLDVEEVVRETDKALLLRLEEDGREVWVPLSQIADNDLYSEGDRNCSISVSQWFAEKEGLA